MTTALATAMPTPMRLGCGLGNHPTRLDPEWTVTYAASKKKVKPTSFRALFSAASSSSPFCSRVNHQTRTPPAKSSMTLSAPKAMRTTLPAFAPAQNATPASAKFHTRPTDTRIRAVRRSVSG